MSGPAPLERADDAMWSWPGADGAAWSRAAWRGRTHPVEVFAGPYNLAGHTFTVRGDPTALVEVAAGDAPLLIAPGALLWRDPGLEAVPEPGRPDRHALRPLLVRGPGHLACAAARPGQVFMLYLPAGTAIDVATDRWLCAAGLSHGPAGVGADFSLERFQAGESDGLLLVYAAGSAYELMLEPGESLLLALGALLYRKPGLEIAPPAHTPPGLGRCAGPGLLAVQTAGGGL